MGSKWRTYTKAIVAALIPVIQVVQAAISDDKFTQSEWLGVIIAVIGAIGVYSLPNVPYVQTEDPPAGP